MEAEKRVRHIRNYFKVRKLIEDHYAKQRKEIERHLAEAKRHLADFRAGKPKPVDQDIWWDEASLADIVARNEAYLAPPWRGEPRKGSIEAYRSRQLARLDAADRAGDPYEIKIEVNWHRSRTWGNCPTAECWISADDSRGGYTSHYGKGHASGCGYDKRSAAAEEAMSCPIIDRLIVEHAECWGCYGVCTGYGMPTLEISGRGFETLKGIFTREGGVAERIQEGQDGKKTGTYRGIAGWDWTWDQGNTWDLVRIVKRKRRK